MKAMAKPTMTLFRRVLTQLGEEICAGVYLPGQVIPAEPILCERLEVSRVVVREAIKALAAKGMLDVRRKTGTMVRETANWNLLDPEIVTWRAHVTGIDMTLANDLLELRRILEPAAARLAAQRATAVDRCELRAAYAQMERAVAGEGDYVAADLAFHRTILRACANPFVNQIQEGIATVLRIMFDEVAETEGGPARSLPLHLAVCAAIEAGDAEAAERAVRGLIDWAERDLAARVKGRNARSASGNGVAAPAVIVATPASDVTTPPVSRRRLRSSPAPSPRRT
jgi:DNA-binding FadR family transcriptional regulator